MYKMREVTTSMFIFKLNLYFSNYYYIFYLLMWNKLMKNYSNF